VGYIHPSGNFDFNVVIRSIVYNEDEKQLSFHVGGGITHYSVAESEYEECMWKAAAIQKVLAEISA
jgi:para-aminobenzoate synthetase component 1